MDRKDFLKSACKLGICSCAGIALFTQEQSYAGQEETTSNAAKQKLGFTQRRFAELIKILASDLDATQKNKILEKLGRSCSEESKNMFIKYENDLEGFLNSIKTQWAEKIDYVKSEKRVTIYGKKMDQCFCPIVDKTLTPTDLCECSIGWQKNTFETIIGKSVTGRVVESILRGGQRCTFSITWT